MNKIVVVLFGMAASQFTLVHASTLPNGLYGWTRDADVNGNVDLVSISTTNGQATHLFSVAIPSGYQALGLTYDPRNDNFYGNLRNGVGSVLFAEVTPTGSITTYAYSGEGLVSPIEGIEYSKDEGGILISGGDNHYRVSTAGVVADTKFAPLFDQDVLVANSFGGELHVFDSNNPDAGYTINKYNDPPGPFGASPTITHVYNGAVSGTESDLAIDPFTNTFYGSDNTFLVRFKLTPAQQEQFIGNYNYPGDIAGIAYVPEPASIVIAGLGFALGGLLVKRLKRNKSPRLRSVGQYPGSV